MNAHWIVGLAHLLDPWVAGYLAFAIVVFLGLWGWAVRLIFQAWTGSQVARRRFAMVFGAGTGVLASAWPGAWLEAAAARQEVHAAASAGQARVTLDGVHPKDEQIVIEAIRHMDDVKPDHSSPGGRSHVVVVAGNGLRRRLVLRTDTADPQNQWVFYEGFRLTANNPIGHAHFVIPPA